MDLGLYSYLVSIWPCFFILLYWSCWVCSLKVTLSRALFMPSSLHVIPVSVDENLLINIHDLNCLHMTVPLKSLPPANLTHEYNSSLHLICVFLDLEASLGFWAPREPSHDLPLKTSHSLGGPCSVKDTITCSFFRSFFLHSTNIYSYLLGISHHDWLWDATVEKKTWLLVFRGK